MEVYAHIISGLYSYIFAKNDWPLLKYNESNIILKL
jgi:hypothetical protein